MPNPTCKIDGCTRPARSGIADWCGTHYHRWYRHGDPEATTVGLRLANPRAYKGCSRPGHPLADVRGNAWVHRVVLFDAIGYGPHACHWCGTEVDWKPKGETGELHVDHLNSQSDDNRLANLVPACRACNVGRGSQRRSQALRDAGWWSSHDTIASSRGRKTSIESSR